MLNICRCDFQQRAGANYTLRAGPPSRRNYAVDPLLAKLASRRAQGLYRQRNIVTSPQGVFVRIDGEQLLSFCSNDYLGLAGDERIVSAFCKAAEAHGVGAGASHLITGHNAAHAALEEELAEFVAAQVGS